MANGLVSIHGRRLGLTSDGFLGGDDNALASASFRGVQVGLGGNEYWADTSPRYIQSVVDDFLGSAISAPNWSVAKGSDAGTVNFATLAAQAGGVVRGTTGAGGTTTMAVNGVQIAGGRNYLVSNGVIVMEADIKPSAIATINFFVGLTDTTIGTLQAPFTISGGTPTANCTNGVGFVFDTGATASTTKLANVNGGGTAALVETGLTPDVAAFHRYRVAVDALGNAYFFIDGVRVGVILGAATIPLAVATTAILAPKVSAFTLAAGSANIDLDWLSCQQKLSTTR